MIKTRLVKLLSHTKKYIVQIQSGRLAKKPKSADPVNSPGPKGGIIRADRSDLFHWKNGGLYFDAPDE